MADYIKLTAEPRHVLGKKVAQLRRDGWTPVVVYGHRDDAVALQVPAKELQRVVSAAGTSHLVEIHVEGEKSARMALVRAVQRHVTRHDVLHADFMQVRMDEKVRSEVPVVVVGEPPVVARNEGVLDHSLVSLQVEALPADLPAEIRIDVSHLEHFGDAVLVSDLDLGGKVDVLNPADDAIARLMPISRAVLHELEEMEAEAEAAAAGVPVEELGEVEAAAEAEEAAGEAAEEAE